MNRALLLLALLAGTALAAPARAELTPTPIGSDEPRVRSVPYSPDNIIRLPVPAAGTTRIMLHAGEVASEGIVASNKFWRHQSAGNSVVVAWNDGAPTDMQLTGTMPDGTTHTYTFLLVPVPAYIALPKQEETKVADASAQVSAQVSAESVKPAYETPLALLRITYEAEDKVAAAQATKAKRTAIIAAVQARRTAARAKGEQVRAKAILANTSTAEQWRCGSRGNGARSNFMWRGSAELLPTTVCTDGRQTMFYWPGQLQVPAIFWLGPDGSKHAVSHGADPDRPGWVIVPMTNPFWRLSQGKVLVADLYDATWNRVGQVPETDTISPRVRTRVEASVADVP